MCAVYLIYIHLLLYEKKVRNIKHHCYLISDHKGADWPWQGDSFLGDLHWQRGWLDPDQCRDSAGGAGTGQDGVMEQYHQAAVPPPVLLYVDCGRCVSEGASKLQTRYIWHFMRRRAVGGTTTMLYHTFMGCLSACTFEWDAGDLALLRQMTREQLRQEGVLALTDLLVDRRISRSELSQYCCRNWWVGNLTAAASKLLPDCFHHAAARCPSLS